METEANPTAEQARTALGEADEARASVARPSATPWPLWFTSVLAFYCAALPIVYGGIVSNEDWLLPRTTWLVCGLLLVSGFLALFTVASRLWIRRTGVALRLDLLPKRVTLAVGVGYPVLSVGAVALFRFTGSPVLMFVASAVGLGLAVGSHLTFVRLHRKAT